jgi:thiamine monophosphate synthase
MKTNKRPNRIVSRAAKQRSRSLIISHSLHKVESLQKAKKKPISYMKQQHSYNFTI